MIFINKFKETLHRYLEYLLSYKNQIIAIFFVINLILYCSIYYYGGIIEGSAFCFLLFPVFLVHLMTDRNKLVSISPKDNTYASNKKYKILHSVKFYLFKYLKFYLVFLMIFLILYLFSFLSSILSLFTLITSPSKSLGQSLLLMFSMFIYFEGLYTSLCTFSILIFLEKELFNPFKAIYVGRKRMKKVFFKHIFNTAAFGLITLPLIFIADVLISYPYLYSLFVTLYVINILNFTIFDLKNRFNSKEEMKSK